MSTPYRPYDSALPHDEPTPWVLSVLAYTIVIIGAATAVFVVGVLTSLVYHLVVAG